MMNNQNIPTTGNPVNIPGIPNNQVYQNGIQNQQPVSNGIVQASSNGIDPARAYVNHVMVPLARAVAKHVPILLSQGVNITEQVVLERIFFAEFQSVASAGAGVLNSLPATGIRAPPKVKNRSRVPGLVRTTIPGFTKFCFPMPGQETMCWWTFFRGDKDKTNCPKPAGRNGIFCEACYKKKTAIKNYAIGLAMARGKPLRDYLLALPGSSSSGVVTGMRPVSSQVIPPKPAESSEICVSQYPGDKGVLFRTPEGLIYATTSEGVTTIGFDGGNSGIILPFRPENMGLINPDVHVNDSLAKQYAAHGGLQANQLNSAGQLATNTSVASIPTIPQTANNVVVPRNVVPPQGIPGIATIPQNNVVVPPQGIPGIATIPQNSFVVPQNKIAVVPQAVATIPQNNVAVVPQTVNPQGMPGVSTIPQNNMVTVPQVGAVLAPISANTAPIPVGSALAGARATPLVGLTNQN